MTRTTRGTEMDMAIAAMQGEPGRYGPGAPTAMDYICKRERVRHAKRETWDALILGSSMVLCILGTIITVVLG